MKNRVAILFAIISLLISVPVQAVVQYTVTDLGTLGGAESFASFINASGQVVGYSDNNTGAEHAFLYSGGSMQDLGAFGGTVSDANSINSSGQIVGVYEGSNFQRAFKYSNGVFSQLGSLGGSYSCAVENNDSGQIVGWATISGTMGYQHAFSYSEGIMHDLGTLGGPTSWANSVNSSGNVVGAADTTARGKPHAFLYSSGVMHDLGTLAGGDTNASSINDQGQIVGSSMVAGYHHGFLYDKGTMQDLGAMNGLESFCYDINSSGQIVGYCTLRNYSFVATIYQNGTMQNLNDLIDPNSGWHLTWATSINDSGCIVGQGSNALGVSRAFLLTPVPEPSAIALLGMGAIGLLGLAWRRKRTNRLMALIAVALMASAEIVQADVFNMPVGQTSLDMVTVGNPGNAYNYRGIGQVNYVYSIGKFEITNAQWREFLNAKASVGDPYGLYDTGMAGPYGGIIRTGSGTTANPWIYLEKNYDTNWDNRPVNFVSFWDAARFCNWLHNGQNNCDTENGAYINIGNPEAFARQPGAKYYIPTEHEWSKAAFYDPNKLGGPDYWDYPTGTNQLPNNGNPGGDTGNSANFYDDNYTLGNPYWTTPVGYFSLSDSPYGTYDQGGNLYEWNETVFFSSRRGLRGGDWSESSSGLYAYTYRDSADPRDFCNIFGFRVASSIVPEPSTLVFLVMGAIGALAFVWRRAKFGRIVLCFFALLVSRAGMASAADVFKMPPGKTSIQFVDVGNPGNAPDTLVMNDGTTGYGSVNYRYKIGKCEITAAQYCVFLNAAAKTDPYGLYDSNMYVGGGCMILRKGVPGSFTYSVHPGVDGVEDPSRINAPVSCVTWCDAARFCNWLQTGDTEDGAYSLLGHTDYEYIMTVTRNDGAQYFLPNENEWYKAAYYKGNGTNSGYWKFPTQNDSSPVAELPPGGNNSANYNRVRGSTDVGAFVESVSAYGTYDQGGNVYEWNESALPSGTLSRCMRGGSFNADDVSASFRLPGSAILTAGAGLGFRIASVPEPSSMVLLLTLAFGGLLWLRRAKA